MPFSQTFYHLIWATKQRHPLLTETVEHVIHNFLRTKAIGLGATVFAINGVEDHVHLVVSIPPKIAVSTFIGQIKAVVSTKFNKSRANQPPFYWQEEYGVLTFDGKRLPNYIAYVARQKEHHANQTVLPLLERTDDMAVKQLREMPNAYHVEDHTWRQELIEMDKQAFGI